MKSLFEKMITISLLFLGLIFAFIKVIETAVINLWRNYGHSNTERNPRRARV